MPKGKSLIEYNLQIFDKFGNLLWENNEINPSDGSPLIGWDGTSNGSIKEHIFGRFMQNLLMVLGKELMEIIQIWNSLFNKMIRVIFI